MADVEEVISEEFSDEQARAAVKIQSRARGMSVRKSIQKSGGADGSEKEISLKLDDSIEDERVSHEEAEREGL
eukprot:951076-Rhodomonas_salina.1